MGPVPPERHITDPGKEARTGAGIPVVPVFDGYRAFAILAVVMLHVTGIAGISEPGVENPISRMIWGTLGHAVEILFVVSGFVVFLPTVARQGRFGSKGSFAIRRGARLLPAYWMILLVGLLVILTIDPPFSSLPGPGDLLANFTGTMVPADLIWKDVTVGFGVNPPLWTLSAEIAFYLVLPFVATAFFRHPRIGLAISLLITVAWSLAFEHIDQVTDFLGISASFEDLIRLNLLSVLQFPTWVYSFGLGMFGAWAWVRLSSRPGGFTQAGRLTLLSGGVLLATTWAIGGDFDRTRDSLLLSLLFSTALATFMVAYALAPASWQRPLAAPRIRVLGDISYGIYLSHMLIAIVIVSEFSLPRDGDLWSLVVWTAAVVPASILYGYLSARFLEQPIRRWARKYGRSGLTDGAPPNR